MMFKHFKIQLVLILIFNFSCVQNKSEFRDASSVDANIEVEKKAIAVLEYQIVNKSGVTLESRFNPPEGLVRKRVGEKSFASYLRKLPLKKHGEKVKYYNGEIKQNYDTYIAVVDKYIGKKNLHQCADAVMRLKAEYLYSQKEYNKIHFNFTNGFRVDYSKWMEGNRMVVKGNKTYWKQSASPSNTQKDFWNYMELIFMYAGTWSLEKELKSVSTEDMQIGDVFIQGGSPGHAVIVVDMAVEESSGKKVFMLAQSYMPAQELQILHYPVDPDQSPWYDLDFGDHLETPEWTFKKGDLKRFED